MNDYKELIEMLRSMSRAIIREDANALDMPEENIWDADANALVDAANAIERLTKEYKELDELNDAVCKEYRKVKKERDAVVDDLEKCMHYAKPKNNNVCNFCKKDMSEYPDKCDGWSDFCECEPEWRGVRGDNDEID